MVAQELMKKILEGRDIRRTLSEVDSLDTTNVSESTDKSDGTLTEDIRQYSQLDGMSKEENDKFMSELEDWFGSSGTDGWRYRSVEVGSGYYNVLFTKIPAVNLNAKSVWANSQDGLLTLEFYFEPLDKYAVASGDASKKGMLSALRDLKSFEEDLELEYEEELSNPYPEDSDFARR